MTVETGGGFLLAPPSRSVTPDDLDDDARAVARTIDEFYARDVTPALPALDRHEPGAARALLRKAAALGLTAMQVPERLGGLGLDLPVVVLAAEHIADSPSYQCWHNGHAGLGTLPLVYYGTPRQQARYLPGLLAVDQLAAYALTEPHAGSDALAARTRADLSPDGRTYLLTGQKAWITNGGEADLFTVFAKVGGEHFTAFLVERGFGVRTGPEERKMGLDGTSTTPVYFDRVPVPVENVLGAVGSGHRIALNILNDGRLKLGAATLRAARNVRRLSLDYARQRQAFGAPIVTFGAVAQKLADMAVRIFLAESILWRATGLIHDATRAAAAAAASTGEPAVLAALEEFAIECAIVKVAGSEMLDAVADHGVQIHGGYGVHRDYAVERAFRDARVNRIFEGTNEINRLVIVRQIFKRLDRGRLAPAAPAGRAARRSGRSGEAARVDAARSLAEGLVRLLHERIGGRVAAEQELALLLADVLIDVFGMQAVAARAARPAAGARTQALAAAAIAGGLVRVEQAARAILARVGDAPPAPALAARARALGRATRADLIALHREILAYEAG